MAIDNTENPEEGTPRSKKDIRKERRQMKSINAEREKMGGEPLYGPKDFEEIKKPFKAEPGKALSGTIGNVTYNDPNKPAISEPTYEYQKVGSGSDKSIGPTTITKEQATALNSEDINAGEKVRQVLSSAVTPNSAETTQKTLQTTLEKKPNLTLDELEKGTQLNIEVGNEVNNTEKAITKEEVDNKSKLQQIVEGPQQYNWTDTYVTTGFEPESPEDINARAANAARQKAPQLVIEKLGVQDYYPEIGRDIAVGTFSGSRIGSQTIYSGAGGLLPLGLYDARKRAIATEIKRKEALMDQLREMPDIAKQYKPAFAQDFYEGLQNYVDAYKDNPDGLASDPGFLKYMANKKSVAENFTKTDAYLKDLESKLVDSKTGQPAAWVTDGMLKIINNVKTGMIPGKIEDYFSGKKNIAKVLDTVRALPNALKQGDEIVKTLIKDGAIERAINLKTGKEFKPEEMQDLNNLIQQLKSPSPDYEVFSELKKKYFDFDYEKIADEWVDMNLLDQPENVKKQVKESMANYILQQMPKESIISTITKQANDAAQRRGQDLDLLKARERMAFEAEQNRLDREDSITKLDIQEMLNKGETTRRVNTPNSQLGTESSDDMIYTVYDPKLGKTRQISGSLIKQDQAKGKVYYDRTGKNKFNVPKDNIQYEQGSVTYYNNNGNVTAISKGTAYTTRYNATTGTTEYVPLSVDVQLPVKSMTKSSGVIDNARSGEFDIIRSKPVKGAAEGTGGTGSYSTGSSSYRKY